VQRGSFVYVYDEKGWQLASVPAGKGLQGYTGSTVSVKRDVFIYTYYTYDDGGGRSRPHPPADALRVGPEQAHGADVK
jgi:hypothetical protein